MTDHTDNPRPVAALLCSVCGENWDKHKRYLDPEHDTVTLRSCIEALRIKNQGPVGLVGPIGAMGPMGPSGVTYTPSVYAAGPGGFSSGAFSSSNRPSE